MPTIIMTKWPTEIDGSVRSKAMSFLQKLSGDDTLPGLHVEPIALAVDPRVRTGRVDQFWRAVMFRLDHGGEAHYVIHGVWPHDDAIEVAKKVRLTVNPINGLPTIESVAIRQAPPALETQTVAVPEVVTPLLETLGVSRDDLVSRLGVPAEVADQVLAARTEDEVLTVAQRHDGWLGLMLVDLATGDSVDDVAAKLQIEKSPEIGDDDADVLRSLQHPAARMQFAFIEDQDDLRRVIESGDFGRWRVFLHPEQRRYVEARYKGPARVTGGAGTGKTVVVVHRARALHRSAPQARIVMTTFTTNLADSMRESLEQLDPRVTRAAGLGKPGVHVAGVDALAAAVLRAAGAGINQAIDAVLGEPRTDPNQRVPNQRWHAVLGATATTLPDSLANETFLKAEYETVVVPHRVRTEEDYLRVRRPGRGTALDRRRRKEVWRLIGAYRAHNRVDGSLDYAEAAAIAAAWLEGAGGAPRPQADHVLVDEGQDLGPAHWQMLRALVAPGPDDLFIAEDSHQRIYGPRLVLSRFGINVVGRARRLTLNYRTTAQNLRYAMGLLSGATYVDLDDEPEATGYRSARTGPKPDIRKVTGTGGELQTIADVLQGWLAEDGVAPETIAVLVHDRFARERVVSGLAERGVTVRGVDREKPGPGRPLVMTMHRAKGLEFAKVVLAGVGTKSPAEKGRLAALDDAEREDAELRARSLTYVAATRARDELIVVERE